MRIRFVVLDQPDCAIDEAFVQPAAAPVLACSQASSRVKSLAAETISAWRLPQAALGDTVLRTQLWYSIFWCRYGEVADMPQCQCVALRRIEQCCDTSSNLGADGRNPTRNLDSLSLRLCLGLRSASKSLSYYKALLLLVHLYYITLRPPPAQGPRRCIRNREPYIICRSGP